MTGHGLDLGRRVADLRAAFDGAFAEPHGAGTALTADWVAIQAGGDPYALPVADLAGIAAPRKIVAFPSRRRDLLGMAGLRGALVAVYDLASLLGYGAAGPARPWLALCAGGAVAFAFERLEGFVRLPREELSPAARGAGARRHVSGALRVGDVTRLVVDMRSALEAIEATAGATG